MSECSVEACTNPTKARGWCRQHYRRWVDGGDVKADVPVRVLHKTPAESFAGNTERRGDCLVWTGVVSAKGYGRIHVAGRFQVAHRYAWEQAHGPIPDGMQIDHTCWNRACVDVAHLRLATRHENAQNLSGAQRGRLENLPRGVDRSRGGYRARVHHNGVGHHRGTFATVEEAAQAAEAMRRELFGTFAGRGGNEPR